MNISGTSNPIKRHLNIWEYIPTEVKPFSYITVAILGGESSGKSTFK